MEKLRSAFDRLKGAAENLTKTLKEEFEVDTIEEAEELCEELQTKVLEKESEISRTLQETKELIEEMEKEG